MIYEFCNTYNIYKYCAVEADSLEEAIIRLQLPENKFERKSEKEKLINTTYRYHLDDGQLIMTIIQQLLSDLYMPRYLIDMTVS